MKLTAMPHSECAPTSNDLAITGLAYRALAAVRDAGRFGDRKIFVSALWTMMRLLDAESGSGLTEGCTIEHFKAWLLRSRRLTRDGRDTSPPLVVLARADFVAAMDPVAVAASEIITDGATFHFVFDPAAAPEALRAAAAGAPADPSDQARTDWRYPVIARRSAPGHRAASGSNQVVFPASRFAR